jgi:hypothetical protein
LERRWRRPHPGRGDRAVEGRGGRRAPGRSRGIELRRHGNDLLRLCPFHDDREPLTAPGAEPPPNPGRFRSPEGGCKAAPRRRPTSTARSPRPSPSPPPRARARARAAAASPAAAVPRGWTGSGVGWEPDALQTGIHNLPQKAQVLDSQLTPLAKRRCLFGPGLSHSRSRNTQPSE